MKKIFLLDGMSLIFRAFHALGQSNLKSVEGIPTGAIFGFTNIITSLLEREKPEYIAIVFDRSEPTFRHVIFPEYKANREAFPEDLSIQLPLIKELINYIGIPQFEIAGYEADDIIGSIATQFGDENSTIYCVTSDKDYFQLVSDYIKVYKPGSKGEDFQIIDYKEVLDKFGVNPNQVIDVMALIGDSIDNVPGVKGIGEKTAIPLIQKYQNLENLYNNIDKIEKASVLNKLIENKDNAFLSKELVTIKTDINLNIILDDLKFKGTDYQKLDEFFAKVGFNTIRLRWKEKAKKELGTKEIENDIQNNYTDSGKKYILIDNYDKLNNLILELNKSDLISFDLETDSLDRLNCEIVGIAISNKENIGYYIPVENYEEPNNNQSNLFNQTKHKKWDVSLNTVKVLEKLKPIMENENIGKCGQNSKFDIFILKRYNIEVSPLVFDTMVASYIINPDDKHNLDALSRKYLNYSPISITSLIGEKKSEQISMREVNPEKVAVYAAEDADLAFKLTKKLAEIIKNENLNYLANEIEFPLVKVLVDMEYFGVSIDKYILNEISKIIELELNKLYKEITNEVGYDFNIDSPKQLGEALFEKMKIPPIKKNKTGYSTDIQVLNELSISYPFVSKILEYRHLGKLKSTYIDALPKLINPRTNRIHTNYNQTVASTGRLSSTDPNLQNIPIRTDLGKEIRKAFVPKDENYIIMSADYSQIELRIMAFMCQDEKMINSFKIGQDIHSSTASILYNIPIENVDSDMRRVAKTVNFGIMYGLGSFGLSQRLRIPRKEAKEIIDNYFDKYPGIKKYMDKTIEETRKKGYAETLCGRRRYFSDINSKNNTLRTAAERGAINMPIQGTASDMLKIAMNQIYNEFKKNNLKTNMILQVHDELVFEVEKNELQIVTDIVKSKMTNALSLGEVPIIVDIGIGSNWLEAH